MGKYTAQVDDHLVLPARVSLRQGSEGALRFLGRPVPSAVLVRFLIDTGSKRSTLIPSLLEHLAAEAAQRVRVITSTGSVETQLSWVRIEFPGTSLAPIPQFPVARLPLPPRLATFHGLVGRDMLSRWESFTYEGRRNRFTLRDAPGGLLGWLRRAY